MSKPLGRSSGGCWTCRIRHRKCDEATPTCKECTDRHIVCHGYGTEPDWVKDPVKLQAELQRIKHAVKQNFRRTRKLQASSTRSSNRAVTEPSGETLEESAIFSPGGSEYREAELLTYYLDYIFPLQYAYYVDKPALGGRGWLFWLLSKQGPLRQAAFTLSALHQHAMSQSKTEEMESELIRYHTNAMQELRQVLIRCETDGFASHPEHRVEFLTCGTFLISFEVFQGGTTNWQSHLNALVLVAGQIDLESVGGRSESSTRIETGFQRIMSAAIRFHVSQLLWFELLSCVSTGEPPRLPYQRWLSHEEIDVSCVMGCQNWAMLALGDVASLEAQVTEMNPRALSRKIADITKRLEDGVGYLGVEQKVPSIPSQYYGVWNDTNSSGQPDSALISQSITRIYATAVLVQLHTISANIEDAPENALETIHNAVSGVMDALQSVPDGLSLKPVTWAMCVAGAMAAPDQQPFFENLIEGILESSGSGFTNVDTVLRVLKECWRERDYHGTDNSVPRNAMSRLGICALLI
ncbi:hypothetical protein CLIM01_06392 [Colletotrichum limetticola]|uniref:Zn(2)-C6 fungal-type domain-containing protein n=1 Tax=Colletotrichum limetticola TaxID=1209924 RepID=A0ABQ9PXJ2_9PEZI|nr:hypothetical protein CLIM01_06392 [Colletotrichum limetticola]